MESIRSPLSHSNRVVLLQTMEIRPIVLRYQEDLSVDVERFFAGIDTVRLYRCLDTGYRFYYPFTLAGDEHFYQALSVHPWYYMPWKWEYQTALEMVLPGERVLEIGCGRGHFLQKLREKGAYPVGLEMNSAAVSDAHEHDLSVSTELIEDHAREHRAMYDVVCAFQVVEHISRVREFLQAALAVLKPNGKLIISVPNNECLVFTYHKDVVLNMPPHHMGLWDMNSLLSIQKMFGLLAQKIFLEPMAPTDQFGRRMLDREMLRRLREKYGRMAGFVRRLGTPCARQALSVFAPYLVGHSLLVQYCKRNHLA